jgi:pimeloyl-ACP methyl ester carboxylesterase
VVQAWSFHTRSEAALQKPLLSMHAAVNKAPLGAHTIVSDKIEDKDGKKNRQIVAKLKVPNFVAASDGLLKLDAAGEAVQQGEREIELGITIPSTVDGPRPVILFGHGFLGSWVQGTRGSFNDLCTDNRFSAVMSFFGFNDNLELKLAEALSANMGAFESVVAEVLQTFANYTALARLVKERLAQELTQPGAGGPVKVFDPAEVHYMGISNGGTFGFVVAATSPQLTRANIVVGGGGLVHFLQRSVVWNGYRGLVDIIYPDARNLQLMMSLMQIVIDPIDSMNYVEHLVQNRFPGCQPIRVAMHMAVNDSQVHNLVSEWVARTADIPLVTPSPKTIYGLRTTTAPQPDGAASDVPAVLFVYDEKVTPYPAGNIPPATDNNTHGTVCKLDVYKKTSAAFIEKGKLIQFCDGACDPN